MKYKLKIMLIICLGLYSLSLYAEMRDPTRPVDFTFTPISQQGPLELSAIISSSSGRVAVINGALAAIGDSVYGNKVVAIDVNTVQLQGASGRITLFLLGSPIKQTVQN